VGQPFVASFLCSDSTTHEAGSVDITCLPTVTWTPHSAVLGSTTALLGSSFNMFCLFQLLDQCNMLQGSECSMSWNAEGMPQSASVWLRPQFIVLLMA
jgi:hypothetical protein